MLCPLKKKKKKKKKKRKKRKIKKGSGARLDMYSRLIVNSSVVHITSGANLDNWYFMLCKVFIQQNCVSKLSVSMCACLEISLFIGVII